MGAQIQIYTNSDPAIASTLKNQSALKLTNHAMVETNVSDAMLHIPLAALILLGISQQEGRPREWTRNNCIMEVLLWYIISTDGNNIPHQTNYFVLKIR